MAFLATMAITEEMDHLDLLVQLESRALLDHLGLALFVHVSSYLQTPRPYLHWTHYGHILNMALSLPSHSNKEFLTLVPKYVN
jgi:hypothetical protein